MIYILSHLLSRPVFHIFLFQYHHDSSSQKSEAIPEVGFISFINHLHRRMDFFVGFLCNENLLRVLYSGIGYKLMPSLIFVLFDPIQT